MVDRVEDTNAAFGGFSDERTKESELPEISLPKEISSRDRKVPTERKVNKLLLLLLLLAFFK